MISYVASQLNIADPQCIVRYAERVQTQQEHTLEIRKYSGYKEFSHRCGGFALMRFLYARIWIGTERPSMLFDEGLRMALGQESSPARRDNTYPSYRAHSRAGRRTLMAAVKRGCFPGQRMDLEGLLARAGVSRITNLERLRRAPSRASGSSSSPPWLAWRKGGS